MNRLLVLGLSILSILYFNACDKDSDNKDEDNDYGYRIQIMSPDTTAKKVGDNVHLHVMFESTTGKTVHNVNVKVYNKADNSIVLFDEPSKDTHVHETDGKHEIHGDIELTEAEGVQMHTNWIVEAKVWPHGDDDGEGHDHGEHGDEHAVTETVEFHVHPN